MSRRFIPAILMMGFLIGTLSPALRAADPAPLKRVKPTEEPAPSDSAVPQLLESHGVPPKIPASPISKLRTWWQNSMARLKQVESVQMVTAVLDGSQMGPGDGWFHPGQSRYGWDWLVRRYDADADGVITADEFAGPAELFETLDRDRNGELKPDDFDWSDRAPFLAQQSQAGQWFSWIDNSSNGRITPDEWQQFFEKLAGEKAYVSRDDLRLGLFPPPPKRTVPPRAAENGPSPMVFLKGLLNGELGSLREGPGIGQPAPDFELETQDGKRTMRLSAFRGNKPVVLVFGSFT